jgi:lipid II:glycine glycyltransferase (peptidoglycan interpeptide bridge formation enzyme)
MKWKGFGYNSLTLEIDLSPPIDKIYNSISKKARWGIQKAIKSGLCVSRATQEEKEKYYDIYMIMCKKKGIKHHLYSVIEEEEVLICQASNQIIGGVSLVNDEELKCKVLHTNASNTYFYPFCPNNLLYWEAIKQSKEQGFSKFDLGGYEERNDISGINHFKEQWGGKVANRIVYTKNPLKLLKEIIT